MLLTPEGAAHSIWLFWSEDWTFLGWYVNLQQPHERTPVGFGTRDQVLDIWVDPDQSWKWKDEDELEAAVRLGRFTDAEAKAILAEGERVIEEWPFPTGWEDWRPDPSWPIPQLPDGLAPRMRRNGTCPRDSPWDTSRPDRPTRLRAR